MMFPRRKAHDDAGPDLVLASSSRVRAELLRNAGLSVVIDPASIDEDEIKRGLRAEGAPVAAVAETLAELKAKRVSARHPGALVLGVDQMLACGDTWFDKPDDMDQARGQLQALAGRTHGLTTAAVVMLNETRLWHVIDRADLTMRTLSDEVIDAYLRATGNTVCQSVGGYQLEGLGIHLFQAVRGDFFTILGLPLLPLLAYLRDREVLS